MGISPEFKKSPNVTSLQMLLHLILGPNEVTAATDGVSKTGAPPKAVGPFRKISFVRGPYKTTQNAPSPASGGPGTPASEEGPEEGTPSFADILASVNSHKREDPGGKGRNGYKLLLLQLPQIMIIATTISAAFFPAPKNSPFPPGPVRIGSPGREEALSNPSLRGARAQRRQRVSTLAQSL